MGDDERTPSHRWPICWPSRGDEAWLRALADTGNRTAVDRLLMLLTSRGDEAGLRALAETGSKDAVDRLAWLLAKRGDEAGLRLLILLGHGSRTGGAILRQLIAQRDRAKAEDPVTAI